MKLNKARYTIRNQVERDFRVSLNGMIINNRSIVNGRI